jgi:hypothetical protein
MCPLWDIVKIETDVCKFFFDATLWHLNYHNIKCRILSHPIL